MLEQIASQLKNGPLGQAGDDIGLNQRERRSESINGQKGDTKPKQTVKIARDNVAVDRNSDQIRP
ncbi:hypothetical protein D3C86_2168480 [compost metagenome]